MFGLDAVSISAKHRASGPHFFSEVDRDPRPDPGDLRPGPHRPRPGRLRRPWAPTSARPTSSPARRASPIPRSASAACSPTPSPGIAPVVGPGLHRGSGRRRRRSRSSLVKTLYPEVTPAEAADVIVPHHPAGTSAELASATARHPAGRSAISRTNRAHAPGHDRRQRRRHQRRAPRPRARPGCDVTVVVADAYPNFSICGIPYYVSGEVTHWRNLAHRTIADLEATGMRLRLDTSARRIESQDHKLLVTAADGAEELLAYDALVVGTGALPGPAPDRAALGRRARPRRRRAPAALDGRHLRASCAPSSRPARQRASSSAPATSASRWPRRSPPAAWHVTQIEQLPEVLPTVDPELGALVHAELDRPRRRACCCDARVQRDQRSRRRTGAAACEVDAPAGDGRPLTVVRRRRPRRRRRATRHRTRRRPPAPQLGIPERHRRRPAMRTNLPDVFAAGDCVITHHRLLGETYLPLGTTAHKQGRVAGENALGGSREFAGSLGTQVVKVFEMAAARTGLRDHEAVAGGLRPGHRRRRSRRPQGLLPRQPPHRHALHRRPPHRAPARRPTLRPPRTPRSPSASTSPPPRSTTG